MKYEVYLAHAHEDQSLAAGLAQSLEQRGFRVWFNSFLVGPSIREQMEQGLRNSEFGVVVLSRAFFEKKWTREELDALFALEEPGQVRILPVWFEVTAEDVRSHSPMLVMRAASVFTGDLDDVAEQLSTSIVTLAATRSAASARRHEIVAGFRWQSGPALMPKSFEKYEREFGEYGLAELAVHPDVVTRSANTTPLPLVKLVRSYSLWDGVDVTVLGHQVAGSVQVFDEIVTPDNVPPAMALPAGSSIAAYVFQLTSTGFTQGEMCYVHCIGPYSRTVPGWGPHPPDPRWLCWVSGVLLAYGALPNDRGRAVNSVYLGVCCTFG